MHEVAGNVGLLDWDCCGGIVSHWYCSSILFSFSRLNYFVLRICFHFSPVFWHVGTHTFTVSVTIGFFLQGVLWKSIHFLDTFWKRTFWNTWVVAVFNQTMWSSSIMQHSGQIMCEFLLQKFISCKHIMQWNYFYKFICE